MYYNQFDIAKTEKKDLFRHGNAIGLCLILKIGLIFFFSYIVVFSVMIFKQMSYQNAANYINSNTIPLLSINVLCTFFTFFLVFFVMLKIMKRPVAQTCAMGRPLCKKTSFYMFGFSMLMVIAGSYATSYFSIFTQSIFGVVPVQPNLSNAENTPLTFLFSLLASAVMPALVEEFAFRGAILGLLKKFGDWPAIIISTLLFSFVHGNFVQIPYTFCLGFALALTRVLTGSIWPCIFIHFINNAFVCIMDLIPQTYSGIINSAFTLFCLIFGLISLVYLSRAKAFKQLKTVPSSVSGGGRFARIFFSPVLIISVVIMLGEALLSFQAV